MFFSWIWKWFGRGGPSDTGVPGGVVCGTVSLTGRVIGTVTYLSGVKGEITSTGRVDGTVGIKEC